MGAKAHGYHRSPFERNSAPQDRHGTWKKAFQETKLFTPLQLASFHYDHAGLPEMIVDRVRATSFISALPDATREEVPNPIPQVIESY